MIPAPDCVLARDLVSRLADADYQVREAATAGLRKLGRAALPALEIGLQSPDAEVRTRSCSLLTRARLDERNARIRAFKADTSGKYAHNLPGWAEFSKVVGVDADSRKLFGAILDEPSTEKLRAEISGRSRDLGDAIVGYRTGLSRGAEKGQVTSPSVEQIAALLLAESSVSESYHRLLSPPQYPTANYFSTTSGRAAATGKGIHGEPFRKLFLHWVEHKSTDGLLGSGAAIGYAVTFDAPVELQIRCATRVMSDRLPHHETVLVQAAEVLARTKADGGWQLITLLYEDGRFLAGSNTRPGWQCQVRDAALALAVRATGQDPAEYGLVPLQVGLTNKFVGQNYGFEASPSATVDQKRRAAFAKWKAWEAAHPEVAPPPRKRFTSDR